MKLTLVQNDVFKAFAAVPSDSIDLVLTSPPYFGLRSYGVEGELGAEPTLEAYLDNTLRWVKEAYRVLKPTGSFVLNLGGCYFTKRSRCDTKMTRNSLGYEQRRQGFPEEYGFYKTKQFLDVGAFAYQRIITEMDFVCRNRAVWCKPNVPSPIRSRLKQSTESMDWFVKNADEYFFNSKPWLRKVTQVSHERGKYPVNMEHFNSLAQDKETKLPVNYPIETIEHSWRIVPVGEKQKGFELNGKEKQEHVAPFPEALVKPWIESLTPDKCCVKCGKPLTIINKRIGETIKRTHLDHGHFRQQVGDAYDNGTPATYETTEKPSCVCDVDFVAGTVLDPFVGSGTVLKIARDLRLNAIGFDLNEKYLNYAKSRVNWNEELSGYDYEYNVLEEKTK